VTKQTQKGLAFRNTNLYLYLIIKKIRFLAVQHFLGRIYPPTKSHNTENTTVPFCCNFLSYSNPKGKRSDSPGGSRPPIPRTQRRTRVLWAPPYRFPSISFLPHEPTFLHARQSRAAPTPNSMGDLAGGAALAPDTGASPHRRRPTTAHPIAGPHGYLGRTPEISPPR
jgi:hypothetical protein